MDKVFASAVLLLVMCISCGAQQVAVGDNNDVSGTQALDRERYMQERAKAESQLAEKDATACDWSDCRDGCYRSRLNCFKLGNETEVCEATYDECTEWCDDNC